jgi:hypothetical protein
VGYAAAGKTLTSRRCGATARFAPLSGEDECGFAISRRGWNCANPGRQGGGNVDVEKWPAARSPRSTLGQQAVKNRPLAASGCRRRCSRRAVSAAGGRPKLSKAAIWPVTAACIPIVLGAFSVVRTVFSRTLPFSDHDLAGCS